VAVAHVVMVAAQFRFTRALDTYAGSAQHAGRAGKENVRRSNAARNKYFSAQGNSRTNDESLTSRVKQFHREPSSKNLWVLSASAVNLASLCELCAFSVRSVFKHTYPPTKSHHDKPI